MNSPYNGKFKVSQTFKGKDHDGLDLVGIDSKEVRSTVNGVVEKAGWENPLNHKQGFGLYVRIKQDGTTDRYYYGHLSQVNVKKGQIVKIGQVIGTEGSTGKSTGSHCHYCVRGDGSKSQVRDVCAISGIPNKLGTYDDGEKPKPVDVVYRVRAGGKWLPEVKNLEDFAGIKGKPITDVAIKSLSGSLRYRVHVLGRGWLPYVTGYDVSNLLNGYAGNGKPIDAIQIEYTGESGQKARYRVATIDGAYYGWQKNKETTAGQDGYAGLAGKQIDRLQIEIK